MLSDLDHLIEGTNGAIHSQHDGARHAPKDSKESQADGYTTLHE